MFAKLKTAIFTNKALYFVIAVAILLLFSNVSKRSFWMDETFVLGYFKYSIGDFIKIYWNNPDNHPPLFYFLVLLASKILPWTELTVRLVSIIAGVGITATVYLFTKRITQNAHLAFVASFFTAFSSFFVLIAQMARYHSLAAFFSLLTFYYFYLLFFEEFKKNIFFKFLICLLLVAYTDYPHFIYTIVIVNFIYIYLKIKRQNNVFFIKWALGQFVVAVLCIPLAYMIFHRIFIQGDGGWTEINLLANSWVNLVAGVVFHLYVFIFGENIFPWNFTIITPGVLLMLLVCILLCKALKNKQLLRGESFVLFLTTTLICLNTLFMNKADPRYNFTIYPKFGFVAFPLFVMLVAISLFKVKSYYFRIGIFAVWFFISAVGLKNFYSLQNYFNGSYFRDFTAFNFVHNNSSSSEMLAITPDASEGVYLFYKHKYFQNLLPLDHDVFYSGKVSSGTKVWFFATGSDGPSMSVEPQKLIPTGYDIVKQFDSVPLNSKFKFYKEKFLHRESYNYKYSVFLLKKI